MKIILQSLQLTNFKGIRHVKVDFDPRLQDILGANDVGKTTVLTAFLWLVTGKDAEGRTDYEIKTTDAQGLEIPKIDHEVLGIFTADGREVSMKRTLREVWEKPRGGAEVKFKGNETVFEWNGVPMREKDYLEKINGLMKADVFRLLTNPLYFNSGLTGYKIPDWQARRNVLLDLAGEISDQEIAAGDTRFEALLDSLTGGTTLTELKQQLAARKKKLKEALEQIPARIDEATRARPEPVDVKALNKEVLAKETEIARLDQLLRDSSESQKETNNRKLNIQNEIFACQTRLQTIESEIRSQCTQDKNTREAQVRELRTTSRLKETELSNLTVEHKRLEGQVTSITARMATLRTEFATIDQLKPEEQKKDFNCPACQQPLPAGKIAEKNTIYATYLSTFNANKVKRLDEIRTNGQSFKAQVEGLNKSLEGSRLTIQGLQQERVELNQQIADLETDSLTLNQEATQRITEQIDNHPEVKGLRLKIEVLTADILALQNPTPENDPLATQRQVLVCDLDALKIQLGTEEQIKRSNKRITELQKEEQELSRQLVELEGIEFVIQAFNRAKMDTVEARINHKFKYARFKLFDHQVNGQEVECCETMYNGVVWGTLNTASRIKVGIDIINVLATHYNVSAPIFLDNRESVTSIPDTDAQIINLIVSPDDKKLRVA